MRMLMATVQDVDGTEAEPVTVDYAAGVLTLTLADGTGLEFDEVELSGAIFEAVHGVVDELHRHGNAA